MTRSTTCSESRSALFVWKRKKGRTCCVRRNCRHTLTPQRLTCCVCRRRNSRHQRRRNVLTGVPKGVQRQGEVRGTQAMRFETDHLWRCFPVAQASYFLIIAHRAPGVVSPGEEGVEYQATVRDGYNFTDVEAVAGDTSTRSDAAHTHALTPARACAASLKFFQPPPPRPSFFWGAKRRSQPVRLCTGCLVPRTEPSA